MCSNSQGFYGEALLQRCDPPWDWPKYNLTIVADGHDIEGNRIHVVKESGWFAVLLDNTFVISEENLPSFSNLFWKEDNDNRNP